MNRKQFLFRTGSAALMYSIFGAPLSALAANDMRKITILHTNDQHSRIDPFPMDGTKLQGLGGFARRAAVINHIRQREKNVLLLDSGDIFQGTPYFNLFHGETEIRLMNEMKYDAATIGNHDFDGGMENLAARMSQANFPFLNCNYDIAHTALHDKMNEYKTFDIDGVRIGVFGVGIELDGLVPANLYGATQYKDPIKEAKRLSKHLKHELHCDLVICLSHLGFKYDKTKVSDEILARSTQNIDLILGGHTHTLFEAPIPYQNMDDKLVLVNQVGWAGICLGQIDLYFAHKNKKELAGRKPIKITM